MPKDQLWFGAKSVSEMGVSLLESCIYRPYPSMAVLQGIGPHLVAAGLLGSLFALFRPHGPTEHLALLAIAILLASLTVHVIARYSVGLLLPKERTGIWVVLLVTIIAGGSLAPRWTPLSGFLLLLAAFFLLCFRVSYFKEWFWNADAAEVYRCLLNTTTNMAYEMSEQIGR